MFKSGVIDAFSGLDGASYTDLRPADDQPYAPGDGVVVTTPGAGAGTFDYARVNAGTVLGIINWQPERDTDDVVTVGQHRVKLNFPLSGSARYAQADAGVAFGTRPMTAGIMLHPAGMEKRECVGAGEPHTGVVISCSGDYLDAALDVASAAFPAPLARFLRTGEAEFFYADVPMSLEMAATVRALLHSAHRGRMRRLHAEAKGLDLICQFFRQLGAGEAASGRGGPPSARDRECVEALRRRLDADFMQLHPLDDMANELGVSDQRLAACFRQMLGMGVSDYVQDLRMAHARRLLVDTDRAITQIAYDMGYDYPGNFSTAFKRRFGLSPRQVRRLGDGGRDDAAVPGRDPLGQGMAG